MEQALAGYLFKHNKRITASDVANYLAESDRAEDDANFDLEAVLRDELERQADAGRVSLTLGQLPLSPQSLKTASASRLDTSICSPSWPRCP